MSSLNHGRADESIHSRRKLPSGGEADSYTIQMRKAALSDEILLRRMPGDVLEIAR
jgi:hypothetical protein